MASWENKVFEQTCWPDHKVNPLSPTSDQDRIYPYTISTISSRQVMRRKISIRGLFVDPIPNSPN